jgi:hypothetical protein
MAKCGGKRKSRLSEAPNVRNASKEKKREKTQKKSGSKYAVAKVYYDYRLFVLSFELKGGWFK